MVRHVNDIAARSREAVAETDAWMIGKHRPHFDHAEIELHVAQLLEREVRRHLVETYREEGGLHLFKERAAQSVDRAFVTEHANVYLRMIRRDEERKSLDVIPVSVGNENKDVKSRRGHLLHERLTEPANA